LAEQHQKNDSAVKFLRFRVGSVLVCDSQAAFWWTTQYLFGDLREESELK